MRDFVLISQQFVDCAHSIFSLGRQPTSFPFTCGTYCTTVL